MTDKTQLIGKFDFDSDGSLTITEHASAPSTPSPNQVTIYAKNDKFLYQKDDAGNELKLGGGAGVNQLEYTVAGSYSIANAAALGNATTIYVTIAGGGGGGGGASAQFGATPSGGAGGGGGGVGRRIPVTVSSLVFPLTVTVGAAGVAGANVNSGDASDGGAGGASSVVDSTPVTPLSITAAGGQGGVGGKTAGTSPTVPGTGGNVSGSGITVTGYIYYGNKGTFGFIGASQGPGGCGGNGGASIGPGGSGSAFPGDLAWPGVRGGGGGGGFSAFSSKQDSAPGGDGYVLIEW